MKRTEAGEYDRGAVSGLWIIVAMAVSAYAAYYGAKTYVDRALRDRPPVIVIDVASFASQWSEGATPEDRARNGLAAARDAARRLTDEGYVVLDRRFVMDAPSVLEP